METPDSDDRKERTSPAAEADVLGEEARNTGKLDRLTGGSGDQGSARAERARRRQRPDEDGSARPGDDENQAGFLKDGDTFGP